MTKTYELSDQSVVVVIGSGAGGGALSNELAQKGVDVIGAAMLKAADDALNSAKPGKWIDLNEQQQLAVMHEVAGLGFFAA